jgi:hypothetical protein
VSKRREEEAMREHLLPRRTERDPLYFHHGLLGEFDEINAVGKSAEIDACDATGSPNDCGCGGQIFKSNFLPIPPSVL